MINQIIQDDCLDVLQGIPDKSVDMILCDLPYGTTACKWDTIIPMNDYMEVLVGKKLKQLNENEYYLKCYKDGINFKDAQTAWLSEHKKGLWHHYERVIKDNGAIVLTASQPFTSLLITSNLSLFKYCWEWEKSKATGFLNSKKRPLVAHEDVCVFYKVQPNYYPHMTSGSAYDKGVRKKQTDDDVYGKFEQKQIKSDGLRYPRSVQYFKTAESEGETFHKTQKPVAMFEYFIRTYTNEGDVVLDNCIGSGTTAIASLNTGRNFIGIEKDEQYHKIACERVQEWHDEQGLADKKV